MVRFALARFLVLALLAAATVLGGPDSRAEEPAPEEKNADANDEATKAALDVFKDAFRGDDDAKANAIEALGETKHPKVFARLGAIAVGTDSTTVKAVAARVLGSYRDKRTLPLLLKSFEVNEKDPKVFEITIKALGESKDPSVAGPLGKYASSKGPNLNKKIIDGVYMATDMLGKVPCKSAVNDLLKLGDALAGKTNLDTEGSTMRSELLNRTLTSLEALLGPLEEWDPKGGKRDSDSIKNLTRYKKGWKTQEKSWDPNKKKS